MANDNLELLRTSVRIGAALLAALLAACSSPSGRFHDDARRRGFESRIERVGDAALMIFEKDGTDGFDGLHFYLDGDGRPWLSGQRVASDPTTRERLILRLMAQDAANAVLVGRPCYYQDAHACDSAAWTTRRYDERIVSALATQIDREIERRRPASVTVIGYSGGGALAMLVAPRLARLDNVVTVAANLDVAAWAAHHRHTPLDGSMDPARQPPLDPRVRQVHLFGAEDTNVPPHLMRHVADAQADATVTVVAGYDHTCCWAADWGGLLRQALPITP